MIRAGALAFPCSLAVSLAVTVGKVIPLLLRLTSLPAI